MNDRKNQNEVLASVGIRYNETPMRPEYIIKDAKLLELVKQLFITIDQGWIDSTAFDIAEMITNYKDGLKMDSNSK